MDSAKLLIRGASVFQEGGFVKTDILVVGNKIADSARIEQSDPKELRIINAEGKYLLPGLIDMHVHFREPGFSYKETILTGSLAGAAGGYTTVCTMPNLKPSPDSVAGLRAQLDIINRDACIGVLPFATITRNRLGNELVDYSSLAPFVAGFSDDGSGVQDEAIMKEAMARIAGTGKILAAHCEVEDLLEGGYIHKGGYAARHNHKGICSESEWREVERDIRLAAETGCRLHICHVSTKESVELIRQAKKQGLPVTAETGPHYLAFTDEDLQENGRFKMNPPIRSIEDREALRQGIADGTIDVIATDHAPHAAEEKSRGLEKSAMGVVGLETAFAAVYTTMVESGLISFEKLVEVMSLNPARILRLENGGCPAVGRTANFTLVDINRRDVVDPSQFRSKGKATPFEGHSLKGRIDLTVYEGQIVYDGLNSDRAE